MYHKPTPKKCDDVFDCQFLILSTRLTPLFARAKLSSNPLGVFRVIPLITTSALWPPRGWRGWWGNPEAEECVGGKVRARENFLIELIFDNDSTPIYPDFPGFFGNETSNGGKM
jgi:hypothetical protein